MKIKFTFTDKPDLKQVRYDERFSSSFEIPRFTKSLPDINAQIIALGELVGRFTNVSLHISCSDIGLKNYPIKQIDEPSINTDKLQYNFDGLCLYFYGIVHIPTRNSRHIKRTFKIYSPLFVSFPSYPYKGKSFSTTGKWKDPELAAYSENIRVLSEKLLALLNINTDFEEWHFNGFHPRVVQKSLITKLNQNSRRRRTEQRKQEREEEKRKQREAKLAEKAVVAPASQTLTHGAGRTVGARPGIYKGIQMRSQLEIRFASELDERGIKWLYECEALSTASYLVDFYLPDLAVWVEVKGKFDARDRQVLPLVAKYLKSERKHRLLVYTSSGKCCVVNPSGFREVERKNFWGELVR